MTGGSLDARPAGPAVGHHTRPVRSSRMKITSDVGSLTGSFANGVKRFSRLLPAQEYALPPAVMSVPNPGLAGMLDQGSGVGASPDVTTTYSRPSCENPPAPFGNVSGGTSGSTGGANRTAGDQRGGRATGHES